MAGPNQTTQCTNTQYTVDVGESLAQLPGYTTQCATRQYCPCRGKLSQLPCRWCRPDRQTRHSLRQSSASTPPPVTLHSRATVPGTTLSFTHSMLPYRPTTYLDVPLPSPSRLNQAQPLASPPNHCPEQSSLSIDPWCPPQHLLFALVPSQPRTYIHIRFFLSFSFCFLPPSPFIPCRRNDQLLH